MAVASRYTKSEMRMLADMPYVPPPDATPEGIRLVNQLRATMLAPLAGSDRPSIQSMVSKAGCDPEGLRYDRSKTRARLHNKEYLVYLILLSQGYSSAAMAEWRTPRSKGRSATKRTASEVEAEACEPADHEDDKPYLFDINAFARCGCVYQVYVIFQVQLPSFATICPQS